MHHITRGVRFGPWLLDLRSGELGQNGKWMLLPNQCFELLVILLQHPGEVVPRCQLEQHLWPLGTFVDFEHGLNAAVKRLRAAIGDDASRPRFIQTLPRRGYRFIATVEPIVPHEHVDSASATAPARHRADFASAACAS
jgi:cholera toxin transcriptional activator